MTIEKFLISVQFHHLSIADNRNVQQGIEDFSRNSFINHGIKDGHITIAI
jgi:hypothetical protein